MKHFLAALAFATRAFAQFITIGYPYAGMDIEVGSTINVEVRQSVCFFFFVLSGIDLT